MQRARGCMRMSAYLTYFIPLLDFFFCKNKILSYKKYFAYFFFFGKFKYEKFSLIYHVIISSIWNVIEREQKSHHCKTYFIHFFSRIFFYVFGIIKIKKGTNERERESEWAYNKKIYIFYHEKKADEKLKRVYGGGTGKIVQLGMMIFFSRIFFLLA